MSQHTPGPWQADNRGRLKGRLIRTAAKLVVAHVNTTCNLEGNREANARLIAKAPEMACICEKLVNLADAKLLSEKAQIVDDARALLREIEGETA